MENLEHSLEAELADKRRKQLVRRSVLKGKMDRIRRELETIEAREADVQELVVPSPDETHVVVSLAERRRRLQKEMEALQEEVDGLG